MKDKEKKGIHPSMMVLFFITRFAFNVNSRMIYPFLSQIGRGLGVSTTAVSSGLSIRSGLTAIDPFISSLADKKGRKPVIIGCMALILAGLGLFLLKPTFLTFVISMCTGNIGCFAAMSAIQAYIADQETTKRAGKFISILELAWSLSFIIGMPLASIMIMGKGWKSPFIAMWFIFLVLSIGLLVMIKESPKSTLEKQEINQNNDSIIKHMWKVFLSPKALTMFGLYLMLMMPSELVLVTFSTWLEDAFHAQVMSLGISSFIIGFAELFGEGLAITLTGNVKRMTSIRSGLVIGSMFAIGLPMLGHTHTGASIALFLFFVATEFLYISCIPYTVEVMPEARAAVLGINGAVIAISRAIADLLGPQLMQIHLYAVVILCVIVNAFAFYFVGRLENYK